MKKMFLLVSLVVGFCSVAFASEDSFKTRGGGNATIAEFFRNGDELLENLQKRSPVEIGTQVVDIENLKNIFAKTQIALSPTALILNGGVVDAINYPDLNRIQLNGETWKALSLGQQKQIILHEILGLARIQDPAYSVSRELLVKANKNRDIRNGGAPDCFQARTFSGPQIQPLAEVLASAIASRKNDHIVRAESIQCTVNALQGSLAGCDMMIANSMMTLPSENLFEVFNNLNVASYSAYGLTEVFDLRDVACVVDVSTKKYSCTFSTYWNWGCR